MRLRPVPAAAALLGLLLSAAAAADPVAIEVAPSADNPSSPKMGDRLSFHTVLRNDGSEPVDGLILWMTLLKTDRGDEQPMDLEDWSAQKAISVSQLAPGATAEADWSLRLIQAGQYRLAIGVVPAGADHPVTSRFIDVRVRQKPTVESARILPVSLGVPMLLAVALLWAMRRSAGPRRRNSSRGSAA